MRRHVACHALMGIATIVNSASTVTASPGFAACSSACASNERLDARRAAGFGRHAVLSGQDGADAARHGHGWDRSISSRPVERRHISAAARPFIQPVRVICDRGTRQLQAAAPAGQNRWRGQPPRSVLDKSLFYFSERGRGDCPGSSRRRRGGTECRGVPSRPRSAAIAATAARGDAGRTAVSPTARPVRGDYRCRERRSRSARARPSHARRRWGWWTR